MLNIPENVKNTFLEESSHKTLKFTTNPNWLYAEDAEWQKDIDSLNLFNGNAYLNGVTWHYDFHTNPFDDDDIARAKINRYSNKDAYDATNAVETFGFKYRNYVNISMEMGIYPTNQTYPQQLAFKVTYADNTGAEHEEAVQFDIDDYLVTGEWQTAGRVSVTLPTYKLAATGAYTIKYIEWDNMTGNVDFYGYLIYKKPIISVSDNPDSFPIQYSEVDYTTLDKTEYIPFVLFDNENIVFDKFSMTESLCSKDNIEFGLCEAGNIEVDVVNVGDVKDETFYPMIGVADPNADVPYSEMRRINWYKGSNYNPSPKNGFNSSWTNQTVYRLSTNRISDVDIASYSNYFTDCNYVYLKLSVIFDSFTADTTPTYIRPAIGFERSNGVGYLNYMDYMDSSELLNGSHELLFRLTYSNSSGTVAKIQNLYFYFYNANKEQITITCSAQITATNLQVGMLDGYSDIIPEFNLKDCCIYNNNLAAYLSQYQLTYVPLGKYTVQDISKKISHNLTVKTLSMYDDMLLLEQNAANWYTHYMYGISTNEASEYGFEFARQIYSSFYDYMKSIGAVAEPDTAHMTKLLTKTHDELVNSMSTKTYTFFAVVNEAHTSIINSSKLYYSKTVINDANPQKLYLVKFFNYDLKENITMPYYTQYHDKYDRGLETCNILIEEELSDGTYNRFAVDTDDFFALSQNVTKFNIYVPVYGVTNIESSADRYEVIDHFDLYSTDKTFTLENASSRLLYYDYNYVNNFVDDEWQPGSIFRYNTYPYHTIFECDSSITGRDVVHSLLELTGCFFRMSRETGEPEFIYCTKSGLYPSNTLYPADDLYPRAGTNQVEGMGKYMSTECADYSVTKFGKIQILKNQTSNKTESNVQWQYIGDEDVGLNTYIIDDNIFYCNKDMTYDTDHMQELDVTLRKMFYMISNMDYTPNVTKALGIPWLECGDRLGLLTYDGGFETFVYRRKLDGIQLLKDTYESHGDEYNNAIKNYGY